MISLDRKPRLFLISCLMTVHITAVTAATGRILDDIEAEQADTAALTAETKIFASIGMGIALSLAQCEGREQCDVIDANEIQQLIGTLDERINDLILRQDGGKGEFTDILAVYVDQRENYLRYQQELEALIGISSETGDGLPEDDTFAGEAVEFEDAAAGTEEIDLSIFEDAEEDLGTDEFSEDDFNPEDL